MHQYFIRLTDESVLFMWSLLGEWSDATEADAAMAASTHLSGLAALLEHVASQRIEHDAIETYLSGVRHVNFPDPDGNATAFVEAVDA